MDERYNLAIQLKEDDDSNEPENLLEEKVRGFFKPTFEFLEKETYNFLSKPVEMAWYSFEAVRPMKCAKEISRDRYVIWRNKMGAYIILGRKRNIGELRDGEALAIQDVFLDEEKGEHTW